MTDRRWELNDDLMHPIPRVHAYDTMVILGDGGAYLGMVIAAPLDASTRSLSRLREKQRFYLDSFYSEYGRREWGTPKDGKMKIYVSVHPESSEEAFEMLNTFEREARDRGVEVVMMKSIP
jgi:hypothetical protein